MTNYMPILPIWGLDLLTECKINHCFILPALWDIPSYRDYYTSRSWKTVIIDNDMYETPDKCADIQQMIDIANSLDSEYTFIVGPEDMENGANTVPMIAETIKQYGDSSDNWNLMSVLHGKPSDIINQYQQIRDLGVFAFGVAVSAWRQGYDRGAILRLIRPKVGDYFHAMGLDSLCEVVNINHAGFDSVDSSFAATCAFNNIDMFSRWNVVRHNLPSAPVRVALPSDTVSSDIREQTSINIQLLREYVLTPVRFYREFMSAGPRTTLRVGRQLVDEVP